MIPLAELSRYKTVFMRTPAMVLTLVEIGSRTSVRRCRRVVCRLENSKQLSTVASQSVRLNLRHDYESTVERLKSFSTSTALAKGKDRGKDKKKPNLRAQSLDENEISKLVDVDKLKSQFEQPLETLKANFVKYLSLRSTVGAIEELPIKLEGKDYTLQQLADIARKPKVIVVNVSRFPQAIPAILDSLTKSKMNLNPQQDGTTLYVTIPKVTKEHRENLSKQAKSLFVDCRDDIKNVRNKYIKKIKTEPDLELVRRVESSIDAMSNQYVEAASKLLDAKQKELLGD